MKLGEICLLTHDVPRLSAFYRALLELPGTCGDPLHQFILAEEPALAICHDDQPRSTGLSPIVLAFTVEDIHAAYQRLIGMQAVIVQPPVKQSWGATNLIFLDPDGNRVYLRQFPANEQEES